MAVTQPKIMEKSEELIELFREFCRQIAADGYESVPTDSAFEDWLYGKYRRRIDRQTLMQTVRRLMSGVKKEYDAVRADVIVHGAMVKAYQPQAAVFALKNLCGWSDKQEVKTTADINMANAVAEVEALVSMR